MIMIEIGINFSACIHKPHGTKKIALALVILIHKSKKPPYEENFHSIYYYIYRTILGYPKRSFSYLSRIRRKFTKITQKFKPCPQ